MHSIDFVNAAQDALVNHQLGAAGVLLLTGLENEFYLPFELALQHGHELCRTQQHCHVGVVSAGM
jgi:hypothetical protein